VCSKLARIAAGGDELRWRRMNCTSAPERDETGFAVHAAICAAGRKSLESPARDAYSAPIDNALASRKDRTMNATTNATTNATHTASISTRIAALVVAVLTSAVVLGSTVAGMQPRDDAGMQVIALERVTVTAPRIN
jgi:hypothetical protein